MYVLSYITIYFDLLKNKKLVMGQKNKQENQFHCIQLKSTVFTF